MEQMKMQERNENFTEIQVLSKYKWEKIINKKLWEHENEELKDWIKGSTKCKKIKNPSMNRKLYTEKLIPEEAMTILEARLGMTKVKANYKNMHSNTLCDLCKNETEDLKHLITCQENMNITNEEEVKKILEQIWEDGSDLHTLSKLSKIIIQKLKGKCIIVEIMHVQQF